MIHISRIRIEGFRGIERLEVKLSPTCVIIGPNNAGKTSVLKALEIALSESLAIGLEDFYTTPDGALATEFSVDLQIIPVDENQKRCQIFSPRWRECFAESIRWDRREREFFAFRTKLRWNPQTNEAEKSRHVLDDWYTRQLASEITDELRAIELVAIDARGDLIEELKTEASFLNRTIHKLLAYPHTQNDPIFVNLVEILNRLLGTLHGPGAKLPANVEFSTHNISHFFEKIKADANALLRRERLAKGTQKTVTVLAFVTLIEMLKDFCGDKNLPLHLVISAEEPETNLHPNAQRSLTAQLKSLADQLIVTTHSPYITAVAEPTEFRAMQREKGALRIYRLPPNLDAADIRIIKRLIMRFRGEVLFARGLVFVEGVTEEQLLRGMFLAYFGHDPSELGINIIGVDGKSYAPFLTLALSLHKPVCIISDNDGDAEHVVLKQIREVEEKTHLTLAQLGGEAYFLSPGLAIEGEVAYKAQLRREIIDALLACTVTPQTPAKSVAIKRRNMSALTSRDLRRRLEKKKSEYSSFLGEIIAANPYDQPIEKRIPATIRAAFRHIEGWLD